MLLEKTDLIIVLFFLSLVVFVCSFFSWRISRMQNHGQSSPFEQEILLKSYVKFHIKLSFFLKVKYLGIKPYNGSFREEGVQDVGSSTYYTMKGLVPGSIYEFQIFVSSVCGLGEPRRFPDRIETKMTGEILFI